MLKNKINSLLLAGLIVFSGSAFSAPQTPRHSKMLYIKQTSYLSGAVCTVATISMPATLSNKDISENVEYFRQNIAAQQIKTGQACPNPVPGTTTYLTTAAEFPPIGIVDFGDLKAKLEFLAGEESNAVSNYYNNLAALYPGWSADDLCYQLGECGINAKAAVDSLYSSNPAYALAIYVRQTSKDYRTLTDETVKTITNYHMNNSGQAKAFKTAVIDYLKKHGILNAFVDIETEVAISDPNNPAATIPKRSAATMLISKNETSSSRGQYTGAVVIPPPNDNATTPNYRNTVHINYTTKLQYPDFYTNNIATLGDRSADFGLLKWSTPSAIDPVMSTTSLDTRGAYDSPFPGQDPVYPEPDERGIFNMARDNEPRGAKCALAATPDCMLASETILSLMRKNSAGKGTFTYYGRWELMPVSDGNGNMLMAPTESRIVENYSALEYDVCYDVRFFNDISVTYSLERLVWVYDLIYSPDTDEYHYTMKEGYPILDKVATTTNPSRYIGSSVTADPLSSVKKFFSTPRDINTSDFVERNWLLPSVPGGSSNAILDPTRWSLIDPSNLTPTGTGSYYTTDNIAAKGVVMTPDGEQIPNWEPKVVSKATTQFLKSSSLPSTMSILDATSRAYHFNCSQINEDQVITLNSGVGYYNGGLVAPVVVSPGLNDGDMCTASYQVYKSTSPKTYMPCTPVAPAITCTGVGPEIFVIDPTVYNIPLASNACTETCQVGGALKQCNRPYIRQ